MQHNHSPPTARKRAPFAQVAGVLRGDWRLPGPQVASRAGITASQSWFIPGRASIAGGDPSSPGWMPSCQHSLAGDTVQAASTGNGHSAQQGREGRWREGLLLGRETRRRPMDAYTRTRCSGFTIRLMVAVKSDAGAPGRGLTAPDQQRNAPTGWQALDKKGNLRRRDPVPSPCCGEHSAAGEGCWRELAPRPSTLSYSIPERTSPEGVFPGFWCQVRARPDADASAFAGIPVELSRSVERRHPRLPRSR
ncbi:MAG: hypothetical protein RLZZ165_115 [Bacteroidota bacterium]